MWTKKKKWTKRFVLPCLLLSCWLLPLAGTTSQAEMMYTISESELTTLETNLQTLEAHNKKKEQQLTVLNSQLTAADKALQMVNEQLAESKKQNEATATSLEKANQSLNKLEKEARHKVQVKARQRNLWIVAFAGMTLYAVSK